MVVLLVLTAGWVLLAPFFVLGRIGGAEERLERAFKEEIHRTEDRLRRHIWELQQRLDAIESPRFPAEQTFSPPPKDLRETSAVVPESSREIPRESESLPPPLAAEEPAPENTFVEPFAPEGAVAQAVSEAPFFADVAEPSPEEPPVRTSYVQKLSQYEPSAEHAEKPGVIASATRRLFSWLLKEGNIWVCGGVFLFFVGFGLLFSYAIQRGVLTLEMRLAAASVTGIVMAGWGFRIRERRRAYALILQGGGMGVLYLVILGATKFNALSTGLPILSPAAAVASMLVLSVFTVLLALLQDYQPLALFAVLGGFVAPILVSTGSRNHVVLFSIYSLLNLEILALAVKRDWRLLNRSGFLLTVGIGTAWGFRDWRPELFASVEPFLLAFFATYTLIALCGGRGRETRAPDLPTPDLLLAVSVPFSFFFLQMKVAGHFEYGMALTCLGLGLAHLLLGARLRRLHRQERGEGGRSSILPNLHMGLCLLFSNLVIPYAFESAASSAIWAAEGAFLVVAAYRCGSYKALLGGILLHIGAMGLYCLDLPRLQWNDASRLSPIFVSGLLFAVSHWVSGFFASRFRPLADGPLYDDWEKGLQKFWGRGVEPTRAALSWTFVVLGSLWWWTTVYDQVPRLNIAWLSVFSVVCLTALAGCWASARLDWRPARFPLAGPLILGALEAGNHLILSISRHALYPLDVTRHVGLDALVYLGSVGASLYLLRKAAATLFSKTVLFAAVLIGLFMSNRAMLRLGSQLSADWGLFFSALPLLTLLFCLFRLFRSARPTTRQLSEPYRRPLAIASGVVLFFRMLPLGASSLTSFPASFLARGSAVYGVFIPLLNPLELWQAAIMLSLALWAAFAVPRERRPKKWGWVAAALLFVWVNQAAARGTWWYWDVSPVYNLWDVARTPHCQAVIAILWGILGLGGILGGQKTRRRVLWSAGAGILAVDMLKLLLIDLNRAATLTRILAFLVLGGLFLSIGWVAPLPPKEDGTRDAANEPKKEPEREDRS
ncbi:MAG: DUF2339 domain-containing protein [Synergistaceae bacterium]|nr:DUF2339 domain-containing protein [Synergistaceae bacterium]